jgi:predicted ATPase/class 3 adenylate cyclase
VFNKYTPTFFFTDIEGSTRLWETDPEGMKTALWRHDAILREAILANHGIVFKTVGDEFCATFSTPNAALNAALAAQRALQAEPWQSVTLRVRMAIHTGAAEERDGDYFGPPVNRVARLMAAGHGGQILLSQASQELVRDELPSGVTLRDMGECRLKDLIRPERIFQVVSPDLPEQFAALRTLEAFRHNLPIQNTSFIGRERELLQVKEHLNQHRLVTLTGPGGTGKTRLSLQAAADFLDRFEDGVWLVELAPVTDPAILVPTVAATFGLRADQQNTLEDTLIQYLRGRNLLLILDNCEHLIDASAEFVQQVLDVCPKVKILASSREALGIPGEIAVRVPSLSLPKPGETPNLEKLSQYEAVRLFIDRAEMVSPNFQVNNQNAPAVAQICYRLDGIPLAIELAAARVRVLAVEQVAARLDDRFRLLTGGSRAALPRQQTLRALIDWSYDLLTESERKVLRWLSTFSNGWTLEAAEFISQQAGEEDGLGILSGLVNKSLVNLDSQAHGQPRYRMLETIRQYAHDRLLDSGDAAAARSAHLAYYRVLSKQANLELWQAHEVEWINEIEAEHDNLRAAIEWSMAAESGPDPLAGLEVACNITRFWMVRGHWREAEERIASLLRHPMASQQTELRARGLNWLGFFHQMEGHLERAAPCFEEALSIGRQVASKIEIGSALLGMDKATEALPIFQDVDYKIGQILALSNLGRRALDRNDWTNAFHYYSQNLEICRAIGHQLGAAGTLYALADIEFYGNHNAPKSKALLREALQIYRKANDRPGILMALSLLAAEELADENVTDAREWLHEMLEISKDTGYPSIVASVYNLKGEIARLEGDYLGAVQAYEKAFQIRQDHPDNTRLSVVLYRVHLINMGFSTLFLGQVERSLGYFKELIVADPEMKNADYSLLGLAAHAALRNQLQTAVRWLGAVNLLENPYHTVCDLHEYRVIRADIERKIPPPEFETAFAEGKSLSQSPTGLAALVEEAHAFCNVTLTQ